MKFNSNPRYRILFLALVIGEAIGVLRVSLAYQIGQQLGNGAGDFSFATRIARDLWSGRDPYDYPTGHDSVSYPLPAGILALPFSLLKDELASGAFMGLSCFILALCILKNGKYWGLLVFLSWPFAYAVLFSQWTPLIMSIWFLPIMSPLILAKPHIAFPLIVTNKVSKKGVFLGIVLLLISLTFHPTWPFVWLKQTSTYRGLPPLLSLPLGPLIAFALIKYRDRRAWLLILLALMPQRVLYDQLPLFLIATNGIEMAFLIFCSWLTLPLLYAYGGWVHMPVNWLFWIILTLYLPALMVLFSSDLLKLSRKIYAKASNVIQMALTR
jgi:hypothetical protein